jgi:hypothetical protein
MLKYAQSISNSEKEDISRSSDYTGSFTHVFLRKGFKVAQVYNMKNRYLAPADYLSLVITNCLKLCMSENHTSKSTRAQNPL